MFYTKGIVCVCMCSMHNRFTFRQIHECMLKFTDKLYMEILYDIVREYSKFMLKFYSKHRSKCTYTHGDEIVLRVQTLTL